jgi:putative N6-adenine-specific DNA methylase
VTSRPATRPRRGPPRSRRAGDGGGRIFCACAPGLEPLLAAELSELGLPARAVPGGAEAAGEDAAALACLASRLADGVLLRLWEGAARELSGARVAAARRAGPLPLVARVDGDRATLSVDAAGAPLFRRGWRARIGAAPLRETLAAALLRAGRFGGAVPFLDPMCGSGTIAIEAALVAARRAPGLGRTLALERLPGHDPARLARLRAHLAAQARAVPVPIHASDRNAGALRLAQKNAVAAGVADAIRFERRDAAEVTPPAGPGLCAVNPPYGVRLEDGAADAWRALGRLSTRLAGWTLVALGPDHGFERLLPAAPAESARVRNGGLACRLLAYRL